MAHYFIRNKSELASLAKSDKTFVVFIWAKEELENSTGVELTPKQWNDFCSRVRGSDALEGMENDIENTLFEYVEESANQ